MIVGKKLDFSLTPDAAKLEYLRGDIELEFVAETGDVLDHFKAKEIVEHFDNEALLEEMDITLVRDWLDAQ